MTRRKICDDKKCNTDDDVAATAHHRRRRWQWRLDGELSGRSIEETRLDEFLKEKFNVAQFRILDTDRLQHTQIAILHRHEDRTQVLEIRTHQMQRRAEVFDRL